MAVRGLIRSLLSERRAPEPPPRSRWDWVLVAVLVVLNVAEGVLSDDVAWRPFALVISTAVPFALLWRRSHPLTVVPIVCGGMGVANVASLTSTDESIGFAASGYASLVLAYALFRWGSGREAAIGVVVAAAAFFSTDMLDPAISVIEAAVGTVVLLFAAALGATMRYRSNGRLRAIDQARLREREQLARELHDTVAHHVSAIAIQAQAGRTLAASSPDAATTALEVIEEAASRTLTEMRLMVTALRSDDEPESVPLRGLADVSRLADPGAGGPMVEVKLSGNLDGLGPSIEASLYRIAQESITNARRHARHATRVSVDVHGDDAWVRIGVSDDGDPIMRDIGSSSGFGLVGMAERATLLGGRLHVGPGADRGWTVHAVLPRGGPP